MSILCNVVNRKELIIFVGQYPELSLLLHYNNLLLWRVVIFGYWWRSNEFICFCVAIYCPVLWVISS